MPRSTQVPSVGLSVSGTGLSPSLAELSSSLPLPTYLSLLTALQPRPNESERFGLFPFRSPLLRDSRLISFPSGTEMFHFPEFAPKRLSFHLLVTEHDFRRVSPFRHLRLIGCLAPPRSFSQLTTSFFAYRRQGIHQMLFSCYCSKKFFLPSLCNCQSSGPSTCQAHAWFASATPVTHPLKHDWWAWKDLNFRPHAYQACALTT